jgi:hypothetical protein
MANGQLPPRADSRNLHERLKNLYDPHQPKRRKDAVNILIGIAVSCTGILERH